MNAETSAWGRAIIAVLAADAKKGIASQQEVRNRRAERDEPAGQHTDHEWLKSIEGRIQVAANRGELTKLAREISAKQAAGQCEQVHADHLWELGRQRQNKLGIHTNKDGSLSRSQMTDEALAREGAMTKAQLKEHNALVRSGAPKADQIQRGPLPADQDPWAEQPPPAEPYPPLAGDRDE
jgi:hypothetical protein